ncbi:DUF485 domain-containing protein [Streptomyces sp. NPDC051976]|uniref:DUF485 domain-containing protein n=1 Tax=Streptomyces sp. NPDC051976 TaxID=3154947 RepID=UPI00343FA437
MSDPSPPFEDWPRQQPPRYDSPPQPYPYGSAAPRPAYPSYAAAPRPPQPRFPQAGRPRHTAPAQASDLRRLRGAYRILRRVATGTALGYFTLFLFLSAFAPSLMGGTVSGGLSTGLALGLLQVPVTWGAVALYEYTARRGIDPIAHRIQEQAERTGPEAAR